MARYGRFAAFFCVVLLGVTGASIWFSQPAAWSQAELEVLQSLWIRSLPKLPPDTTNRVADDPRAQALGQLLFFDVRLSSNGAISCATCHQPRFRFTDQLNVSRALGISKRNAPSVVGVAYSPWLYWDGRKDSLWSQALSPLEDPAEHGGNRMQYARLLSTDPDYRRHYEDLFGPMPDLTDRRRFPNAAAPGGNPQWAAAWERMTPEDRYTVNRVFANIGKAIAAYERLLLPGPSRFDAYVEAILGGDTAAAATLFSAEEVRGLRLFIADAECTQCHNGPLLTNNSFHNTGMLPRAGTLPDKGRVTGLRKLAVDPFNCLGVFSDDQTSCAELRFAKTGPETVGAIRAPSLRNLAQTEPYGHAGQHAQLEDVLQHYNAASEALIGHNEAKPLGLWPWQVSYLGAFLETLEAPLSTPEQWLQPPR